MAATNNLLITSNNTDNSNNDSQYFYEDVVYRIDKRGNVEFGIVMENDDHDLSTESENSSDEANHQKRKKGEIHVVWHPSGIEELTNSKKVHLADRTLMPGDVVRRMIKGKDTQRGYCRDIELTACVQVIGSKQVLTDIKSEDLIPLEEFAADIAVCMDSWVGGIRMVHYKLWLATPDGSRCIINEMEARGLEHFEEKRESNNDFPHSSEFYPGQCLWGPIHCLEGAQWVQCTKEMKAKRKSKPQRITKVVVEKVETDWVGVHWQCRAYSKDGVCPDQAHPKYVVDGENLKKLKLLNVFEPSTLQVGDRNFYVIRGDESVITREQWRKQQKDVYHVPKNSPRKSRNNSNNSKSDNKNKDKSRDRAKGFYEVTSENNKADDDKANFQEDVTNKLQVPPQSQNSDSSDNWNTDESDTQSISSASISSGCSSLSSMGKKKKGPALMTKVLKKRKLCKARKKVPPQPLVAGTKIVVETISTNTKATVVWQDGSVEKDIPSTQLYPIHHLDDKEFFPGDFVVDQKEEPRIYGVVQKVDHQGRTATIKWFKTYTSSQNPEPLFIEEREVSVYDLKDHSDFQYRPGTLVIRIANFEGDDSNCTAGQVLDNYPEGKVKVWWEDRHVSMCWPQDLYKVGDYDSDEGELWEDVSSDGSWETELEDCVLADNADSPDTTENIKPKLAAHIEKARIAMSRLEEIFTQNPALQTTEVMRRLLEVYKDCRYMDKLMGTSFFHESHFQGLLERVRERGRANVAQRMADHVSRLFAHENENTLDESSKKLDNEKNIQDETTEKNQESFEKSLSNEVNVIFTEDESISKNDSKENLKVAEQNTNNLYINIKRNPEDSGLYSAEHSKKESGSSDSSGEFFLSEDIANLDRSPVPEVVELTENNKPPRNVSPGTSHVCVKLCHLIKAQLVLAHGEVSRRFGLSKITYTLSDAAKTSSPIKDNKEEEKKVDVSSNSLDTSTADIPPLVYEDGEGFSIEDTAPDSHKFKLTMFQPTDRGNFFKSVSKEIKLLQNSLPPGIWVKGFEDRMDLYSVMFRGPEKTPYEDGLFLFDFQLSADYPTAPPLCHYISYCSDRLNPNLYEDGKVCVSLLGTWSGRGTEVWTSSSTLLQVIVSIQGLILVAEPYFNEAGFEKQKGSQQGCENSRMYNEMVILKLIQSQSKLILNPPAVFKDIILKHFKKSAGKLLKRLELWMEISEKYNSQHPMSPVTPTSWKKFSHLDTQVLPEFPLLPASKGFCISLKNTLANFKKVLIQEKLIELDEGSLSNTKDCFNFDNLSNENSTIKNNFTDTLIDISSPQQSETKKDNNERNGS